MQEAAMNAGLINLLAMSLTLANGVAGEAGEGGRGVVVVGADLKSAAAEEALSCLASPEGTLAGLTLASAGELTEPLLAGAWAAGPPLALVLITQDAKEMRVGFSMAVLEMSKAP